MTPVYKTSYKVIMYQDIENALNINKTFVLEGDKEYSYADLKKMAQCIHTVLRKHSFSRIIISGKQCFFSYATMVGIYLAGGTFCVLNEDIPQSRKEFIIEKFKPDVYFGEKALDVKIDIPQYMYEDIYSLPKYDEETENILKNEVLYVSFTSGTTGIPKGCVISRKSFEHFCEQAVKVLKFTEEDICAQYVPLSFDMSLIDIFGGVQKNVTLVAFKSNSYKLRPGKYLSKYKITFMNVVPHFIKILENGGQLNEKYLKSLRMIRFGGDKISKDILCKLFSCNSGLEIVSTYGATETTCFCMYKILTKDNYESLCTTHAVVGGPLDGWKYYLEYEDSSDVGNLVIYGDYIGEGYLGENNDIDENMAEKFNSTYFIRHDAEGKKYRAYKTGDYFMIRDRELLFVGRNDSQIKINGKRFNLCELENTLSGLGASESCGIYKDGRILLYYTMNNGSDLCEENILELFKEKVPLFAIPSRIIRLEQMPHNLNGKIDKSVINRIG